MKYITIRGAREHNLKNLDLRLPRGKMIVFTGLSGSGKSSLAFDTIYAEGQRRYVESLSAYARQFLGLMKKPDLDRIEGLSPAIAIEQKGGMRNPRSTVGTMTEIYDHFRLLFARIGRPHCPEHGLPISAQSADAIAARVSAETSGPVTVLAPLIRQKKGSYGKLMKDLDAEGFSRVRINGELRSTDQPLQLERYRKHDIDLVIDLVGPRELSRLAEACELGLERGGGLLKVLDETGRETVFSSRLACPECGLVFEELEPRMFSFNSPFGACETCHGLGLQMEFAPDLIIPDPGLSLAAGAVAMYRNAVDGWRGQLLAAVARHHGFSMNTPIAELDMDQYRALMFGSREKIRFSVSARNGESQWSSNGLWEGLVPQAARLYRQTASDYRRRELEKFMRTGPCPACLGRRLKPKVLAVQVSGRSIAELAAMPVSELALFFERLELNEREQKISGQVLKEIRERLGFLSRVGLDYLSLDRGTATLSGGEAQRIRLATQIGSNLTGVLYVLDEPSIGLHQRDNHKLLDTLARLRDLGNTLVIVEHDEETIRRADHLVDLGPGAGKDGGAIVFQGAPQRIEKHAHSLTGAYLSGRRAIPLPATRNPGRGWLEVSGCREHNLKNIRVRLPLGAMTLVTGVSGSGKSTLVHEIICKGLQQKLQGGRERIGAHDAISWEGKLDRVLIIDQSPIGRTPRSNPATYTKVFDEIRRVFAATGAARMRGFSPARFSFNLPGGRCEACQGDGVLRIEMNFLPDVFITCEDCRGLRYNRETLQATFRGLSIAEVLDSTVQEAMEIFSAIPGIQRKLQTLAEVGLSYIKLGQSSTTLSGGEAQRIKLTRELGRRETGSTVYLLDEPTSGLHFADIHKLIGVLNRLVERGNTVVVIEHNLDFIKSADYIVDLGPEGGDRGGYLVAAGTPEEIAANPASYTGRFLAAKLNRHGFPAD